MNKSFTILVLSGVFVAQSFAQDDSMRVHSSLLFRGQLSSWAHINTENPYPAYFGGRYIPQLNYEIQYPKSKLLDFEASANIYGDAGVHFFDSAKTHGNINPYRLWGRYSTEQLELRIGLQKIDFGTATMLRALRWFDQIDPRDPLQLTEGVWAGLGRYYFLNNVNVWCWVLYGNENLKGNEVVKSRAGLPEVGGRIQFPVPRGETGLSYHYRVADTRYLEGSVPAFSHINENRIGIDAKWDLVVGLWLEAAWIHKDEDIGLYTNQEILTAGTDYTFGIGSGLNVTFEHMVFASDHTSFEFAHTVNFTALAARYPIGMFDNLTAILYYDWKNESLYNFINWFRQFDRTTFYVMGYWNPETNQLPAAGATENLYGGVGIQLMFVFNH